ncbi:hypothetical protein Tco_0252039 [Tanacetum coccineum]
MVRDTIQLETAISTISQEHLMEFTSKYGITEDLHPELPGPRDRIVDFSEGSVGVKKHPAVLYQTPGFPEELEQPVFGWTREYFTNDRGLDMDLFNLIRASNPTKVKIGTRPCAAHEVPLLTVTASRVIEMEEPAAATETEDQVQGIVASEVTLPENVTTMRVAPETDLGKDHAASRPTQSTAGGKSLASVGLETGSTLPIPTPPEIIADASDPDSLSYVNPRSIPEGDVAQSSKGAAVAGDPESENTSFTSMAGSPGNIYQPGWGVTNDCRLDTPKACQDLVDHLAPPWYFSELCHLPNDDILGQYNINLARQVAMGSQLRLRFEQEAKLLKKSVAQVARRDKRIQARENEIKNLEALLEAEADMKKFTEAKNAELAQVTGEEKLKAVFEEFKKYEDDRVEKRCAEMDARLDALSIDFDEELYPHMLTAIAGRRWVIGHGLRLAVMKCAESTELRQAFTDVVSAGIAKGMSEGLKHGVEHGKASLDLEAIEAYDPEADTKYVAALHALRDLKYPMVDQLESLKDAPIDVIMASLHLESDSGEDAPQWIRELRPNSSQLKIPVYPEVRDPKNPWSFKEEILLEDAIAANVSRAEKKKKCRVVCRTHGVGSAHHARSDGVPVSVPTVAPQGLAILLADAATQTETSEDEASPRLFRSKSLPPMYNLDWP